jgi:hypothetical protein
LEQIRRTAAWYGDRPSFPPPPCLAGYFGRSRWTDRLRPNFMTAAIYDSYQFMTVMTGAFYLGRATIRSHLVAAKRAARDGSINLRRLRGK